MVIAQSSWIVVTVIFAIGLLLLAISSAMFRSLRHAQRATWPMLIDDSLKDAADDVRRDMVERLELLDTPWSRSVLERASQEEPDDALRAMIEAALRR